MSAKKNIFTPGSFAKRNFWGFIPPFMLQNALRGETVTTPHPDWIQAPMTPLWEKYSQSKCFNLEKNLRDSRGRAHQNGEIGIVPYCFQIFQINPKCRGSASNFLAQLDPPYIRQSTGNYLYFPMVTLLFTTFFSENGQKSDSLEILS